MMASVRSEYPDSDFRVLREQMVNRQLVGRDIVDSTVLDVMRKLPRHLFVPEACRNDAYEDYPLPIGCDQTISQPYIVASMTQSLRLTPRDRVLEIGTGSGYQTAVLAEIVQTVFSVEVVEDLFNRATDLLDRLGYRNVRTRLGDGSYGWPDEAPFDAIIVTAAAPRILPALVHQLGLPGRMILPIAKETGEHQDLVLLNRTATGVHSEVLYPVRFVPLTHRIGFGE